MPETFSDPDYLRTDQYRDDANLSARVDIHRRFSTNPQGWYGWFIDRILLPAGTDVLELGCGEGGMWAANRDRIPTDLRLTLTDFSSGMLEAARTRLGFLLPGVRFAVVDCAAIPFADASFDVVIANHMLYHVPDIPRALAEIRRVLRPDGQFHAATNGRRHMLELDWLVERFAPEAENENAARWFGLENGAEQLARVFALVERNDYVDALAVTDAEAVIRYVRSTAAGPLFTDERIEALRRAVNDEIATHGAFRITKSTGLFTCSGST